MVPAFAASGSAGDACARFGQGAVAPVGDEFFPALDGAGEVVEDFGEEGFAVAVLGHDDADDDLEALEDVSERGGEVCHVRNYI